MYVNGRGPIPIIMLFMCSTYGYYTNEKITYSTLKSI